MICPNFGNKVAAGAKLRGGRSLHFGTPEGFEASANPNAPSGAERLCGFWTCCNGFVGWKCCQHEQDGLSSMPHAEQRCSGFSRMFCGQHMARTCCWGSALLFRMTAIDHNQLLLHRRWSKFTNRSVSESHQEVHAPFTVPSFSLQPNGSILLLISCKLKELAAISQSCSSWRLCAGPTHGTRIVHAGLISQSGLGAVLLIYLGRNLQSNESHSHCAAVMFVLIKSEPFCHVRAYGLN